MNISQETINSIVKFINLIEKPKNVKVTSITLSGKKEYVIGVYFDSLPDSLIINPDHNDLKDHKEKVMTRKIRMDIEKYLGIKTSGFQSSNMFFPPQEIHGITIVVLSEK